MDKIFKIGLFIAAIAAYMPSFGMLTAIQKMPVSYQNTCKKDKSKALGVVRPAVFTALRNSEAAKESALNDDAFLPKELFDEIAVFMDDADKNKVSASCRFMREKFVDPRILEAQSYFQGDKKWQTLEDAFDAQCKQIDLDRLTEPEKKLLIGLGCTEDDLADKDRFAKKIKEDNGFMESLFQSGQLIDQIDQNESNQKRFGQAVSCAIHNYNLKGLRSLFERNKDSIKQDYCSDVILESISRDHLYAMYARWVKEAIKKNNYAAFAFMIESDPFELNNHVDEIGPIMDDVNRSLGESKREIDWLYRNTCLNSGCKSRDQITDEQMKQLGGIPKKPWFGGIFNGCTIF